ncbi:uncharacterized protein LACBIDRAFT_327609 [Laccaria bicolor S238N-H82]|uniref:Predicted protein n=1 Tax=Laccaria bicolor (strain S238N-H82 / ATCC MYA-4686) TaxID=486041 RepID=B0DC91_LACBS|nr:uncharacterized protein LACBIDRAFT_327609 [Laccaria bicolor S238N-H82]EDR07857.1 predicted protein [Laccaria bicolor S238N-H82]|eukprot:XP_001881646.1 predicted protein [Laccaria bicolor S238N-H82]
MTCPCLIIVIETIALYTPDVNPNLFYRKYISKTEGRIARHVDKSLSKGPILVIYFIGYRRRIKQVRRTQNLNLTFISDEGARCRFRWQICAGVTCMNGRVLIPPPSLTHYGWGRIFLESHVYNEVMSIQVSDSDDVLPKTTKNADIKFMAHQLPTNCQHVEERCGTVAGRGCQAGLRRTSEKIFLVYNEVMDSQSQQQFSGKIGGVQSHNNSLTEFSRD